MKDIFYLEHAEIRRKQRENRHEEIEEVILHPESITRRKDGRCIVLRTIHNRKIKIVYEEKENYIRIITII